ncbi:MAG: mechanosensitive ion channel domain-containing protein [Steroidobacteraceae bacterium]
MENWNTFIGWLHLVAEWLGTVWFSVGKVQVSALLLLGLLLILLLPWFVASGVEKALVRAGRYRPGANQATIYALARILRYGVLALGVLVGLNLLGIDFTALAVLGGAVGIGIGLGLQAIFSNFVSGIILLVEQTLKPGDFVELESGVRGRVIEIGMRYTLIRTNNAVDIIVPNSEFTTNRVTSWTHGSPYRRLEVPFSVAYGSDKALVQEAALAAAAAVSDTVQDEVRQTSVWCTKFGDSALEFSLMVWIGPDAIFKPGATQSKYLWALDDALRERKLEIPFPQRDVHLR